MMDATTEAAPAAAAEHGAHTARRERRRVTRTRRVVIGQLGAAERAALCEETYAVYASLKAGVDRATFEREFFGDDRASLVLFHGDGGALAGFLFATILRVASGRRRHAVFSASIFIDTRYKAANEGALHCILEALRFKAREPFTPLAYLGLITTPASYRRLALTLDRLYPAQGTATPPEITRLMQETVRLRGVTFVDEARGLVESRGTVKEPGRLRRAKTLQDDPHARFYLDLNPRFDEGVAALVWVPLDAANVLSALGRHLLRGARG